MRGQWKIQKDQSLSTLIKSKILSCLGQQIITQNNPHRDWQEKSARLIGWKRYFYLLSHAPTALNKNTFEHFNQLNPQLFYENIKFPFRTKDHTSSIPLIIHKDIKENRIHFDIQKKAVMVNGACHDFNKIKYRLQQAARHSQVTFLCMQSIDQALLETQIYMFKWLDQLFNTKFQTRYA